MGSMEKGDLARIQIRLIGFCMMVVDGITGGIAMVRQRLREQQRARGKTLDPDGTGFKGIAARAEPAFRIPAGVFSGNGFAGKNAYS